MRHRQGSGPDAEESVERELGGAGAQGGSFEGRGPETGHGLLWIAPSSAGGKRRSRRLTRSPNTGPGP